MPTLSTLPWIHGQRPYVSGSVWYETIACIVREEYDEVVSGVRTRAAERELGIDLDSWYWFIGRADAAFGHGVFFFDVDVRNAEPAWLGVSPFDSGGLVAERIATDPTLDSLDEKRAFFATVHHPISEWQDRFELYLSQNYDTVGEYVKGHPPRVGVPPVIPGAPNTSRAWTWEGHIQGSQVAALVRLVHAYFSLDDHDQFQEWVGRESPYDAPVRERILALMQDKSRVTTVNRNFEVAAAAEFLVGRYASEPTGMEAQP